MGSMESIWIIGEEFLKKLCKRIFGVVKVQMTKKLLKKKNKQKKTQKE